MASTITITIGPVTATKTASNAAGQAIVNDLLAAASNGGRDNVPVNGTPQEQVDWFLAFVVRRVMQEANVQKKNTLTTAAVAGVDSRDWV